jgi:glycosyltransferase involved in cell wall biosynthesis
MVARRNNKMSTEGSNTGKRIWITWERQRRNRTLSVALNARLFEIDIRTNRYVRYLVASVLTLFTLIRERPGTVFVQNPSIVLAAIAIAYCRLFRIRVIVDAHNAGVFPFDGKKRWATRLTTMLLQAADLTIVTNSALAAYVLGMHGRAIVLPDPIPHFENSKSHKMLKGRCNVLFICTWAADEPYTEVFRAARHLEDDIVIYVSGHSKGREKEISGGIPDNVVLTGFLSEESYVQLLYDCDVILDLTTREDCLVCGAYEAVAAEKPLIVSNTRALKEYFVSGTVYTDNTYKEISRNIAIACDMKRRLGDEMKELKVKMTDEWAQQRLQLEEALKYPQ